MKRIFICGAAVALIGVATLNVALSKKSETKFSDVSLANVEALANDECDCPGGSCTWRSNYGDSCSACCPVGKNPKCNSFGCVCEEYFWN
jgi:hypothetical protein